MKLPSRAVQIGAVAGVGIVAAALVLWLTSPVWGIKIAVGLPVVLISLFFPHRRARWGAMPHSPLVSLVMFVLTLALAVPICEFAYIHYFGPLIELSYGRDNGQ